MCFILFDMSHEKGNTTIKIILPLPLYIYFSCNVIFFLKKKMACRILIQPKKKKNFIHSRNFDDKSVWGRKNEHVVHRSDLFFFPFSFIFKVSYFPRFVYFGQKIYRTSMFVPARLHFQGLNRSRILRSGIPPPIQYMVGGKEWGEREADEAPKASETPGMLGFTYNGLLTPFRFIDPMWSISRFTVLGREAYFIFPNLVLFFWFFKWYLPNYFLWGDGKKPKEIYWNDEKEGYLSNRAMQVETSE